MGRKGSKISKNGWHHLWTAPYIGTWQNSDFYEFVCIKYPGAISHRTHMLILYIWSELRSWFDYFTSSSVVTQPLTSYVESAVVDSSHFSLTIRFCEWTSFYFILYSKIINCVLRSSYKPGLIIPSIRQDNSNHL